LLYQLCYLYLPWFSPSTGLEMNSTYTILQYLGEISP